MYLTLMKYVYKQDINKSFKQILNQRVKVYGVQGKMTIRAWDGGSWIKKD